MLPGETLLPGRAAWSTHLICMRRWFLSCANMPLGWIQRHLKTLVWMMVGLIHSGWINLTAWAPYGSLIEQALVPWGEPVLYVALDTSMLWNTYCLIHLLVVYRGRAVPLVWCVLYHGSAQVAFNVYQDLLERVVLLLPRRCTFQDAA